MYLLGYEISSRMVKAVLIDATTHEVIVQASHPKQPMETLTKQVGWAEQQPDIWWLSLCMATRKLLNENSISAEQIKAIGISYQMHGLVLIDEEQEVLRPGT